MLSFVLPTPILGKHGRPGILSRQCRPFRIPQQPRTRSKYHRHVAPTSLGSTSGKQQKVTVSPLGIALFLSATFWTLIVLPLMLLLHPILLIFRVTRWHTSLFHFWMRMTVRTSFLPVSTTGLQKAPKTTSLIVSNLQSPLDTFILSFLHRPFLLMVPERAKRAPIVGWMLRLAGMIFVSSDRRGQIAALKSCTEALNTGRSVAIFPEGVPRMDGVIASFPAAVFSAARKSGVPIVPVTLNGSFKMFDSGFAPARRPSEPISVTVHDPVSSDSDDKATALNVREIIRNGLPSELRGQP